MQPAGGFATLGAMAATRTIELDDRGPGPALAGDARAARRAASPRRSRSRSRSSPPRRAARRSPTSTATSFIDFAGGVGCLNVGHSHPHVVAAAQEQLERFSHTDFTVVPYEVYADALRAPARARAVHAARRRRRSSTPAPRRSRTRSSSRARTPGRPAVIGFEGAFHGRTMLSLALTSKTHPYKAGLGPFAPEVYRVPFPNATAAVDGRALAPRAFRRSSPPRTWPRSSSSRCRARAASSRRRTEFVAGPARDLRRARDRPRLRRGADRLRAHRALLRDRALRRRAGPDHGREVDRDGAAALRRARQGGDHGRARRRAASAARTSATRSRRRRRSPCST